MNQRTTYFLAAFLFFVAAAAGPAGSQWDVATAFLAVAMAALVVGMRSAAEPR